MSTNNPEFQELKSQLHKIIIDLSKSPETIHEDIDLLFRSVKKRELLAQIQKKLDLELSAPLLYGHNTFLSFAQFLFSQINSTDLIPDFMEKERGELKNVTSFKGYEPIAVVGMSGIFPGSPNCHEFYENLLAGKDLISEVPSDRWDWTEQESKHKKNRYNVKLGGFINDVDKFDAPFFSVLPMEASYMSPEQRLFLETVWHTLEDAGHCLSHSSENKTGLFVGVAPSDYIELLFENEEADNIYAYMGNHYSVLPNRVSYLLNLTGPSEPVFAACSSSLAAVHRAIKAIHNEECDNAIAGGINIILTPRRNLIFSNVGMLSPEGKCKTFSDQADGYTRSEGVGAIFLKPLIKAQRDNDQIYAVIKGSAVNHGGRARTITSPSSRAQAQVIKDALSCSSIDPATISYVEAHGTGTTLGDPVEINGLKTAFGETSRKNYCGIGSVKSNIGHMESAAGIAGIIKVLLGLHHKKIFKTLHAQKINPLIELEGSPFFVCQDSSDWKKITEDIPRRAGVSSFGFSGTNAHIVLEEYTFSSENIKEKALPLFLLSAKSQSQLWQYGKEVFAFLKKNSELDINNILYTFQVGREEFSHRLSIVAESLENLKERLKNFLDEKEDENVFIGLIQKELTKFDTSKDINSEKYWETEELKALAQAWSQGEKLDFNRIYESSSLKKISLPLYPFAKNRYWISQPDQKRGDALSKPKQDALIIHPLLHQSVLSMSQRQIKKTFELQKQTKPIFAQTKTRFSQIAIIGMSGKFPMAKNIKEFWENLQAGRDCITEIPKERWNWQELVDDPQEETSLKWGGFIDKIAQFDPLFFKISPEEAKWIDPQHRLLLTHTWQALEDAGYTKKNIAGSDVGVFIGIGNSDYSLLSRSKDNYLTTATIPSLGPNRISYFLDIHGPSEPIETACSSSLVAIHKAVKSLQEGESVMAIAGGISLFFTSGNHVKFSQAGMLSKEGRCKTFTEGADGYVRSEGVGILVLKQLDEAKRDSDNIYGVIVASGQNHNGHGHSITTPNRKAQTKLIKRVYQNSGVDPRSIGFIEVHGTGTSLGDAIEVDALKAAFQELYEKRNSSITDSRCALGAVKTHIGHLETASGVASVIKVLLQFQHRTLIKNLHTDTLNPYLQLEKSPFYVLQEQEKWESLCDKNGNKIPRRAGVNSFGFGGVNAHLVLEEYIPPNKGSKNPKRISLPTYPFTQEYYWGEKEIISEKKELISEKKEINRAPWVSPRSFQEHIICQAFKKVLQLDDIGAEDDFFELGGESQVIVDLFDDINKNLGLTLPPTIIFENRTVSSLAKAFEQKQEESGHLVAIRAEGEKPPLICIHSMEGNALNYYSLAKKLDLNQPVYVMSAPKKNGQYISYSSLEEGANQYIQLLQKKLPRQEYLLAGYSAGGFWAYEMARQLTKMNISVPFLGFFDSVLFSREKYWFRWQSYVHFFRYLPSWLYRLTKDKDKYQRLARIFKIKTSKSSLWVDSLSEKNKEYVLENGKILKKYFEEKHTYGGKIHLFRTRRKKTHPTKKLEVDYGWKKYANTAVDIHYIKGEHHEIMYKENIQSLSTQLQQALNESQSIILTI